MPASGRVFPCKGDEGYTVLKNIDAMMMQNSVVIARQNSYQKYCRIQG
jgi:hypothetical protein